VFAQTDEFKHAREVHVWLLAQASMNGKGKRGKTQRVCDTKRQKTTQNDKGILLNFFDLSREQS
jgi:hypothetical protein